jgi:hypothetical protein
MGASRSVHVTTRQRRLSHPARWSGRRRVEAVGRPGLDPQPLQGEYPGQCRASDPLEGREEGRGATLAYSLLSVRVTSAAGVHCLEWSLRRGAPRRIVRAANGMRAVGPRHGVALRARATVPSVPGVWCGDGGVDDRRQRGLPAAPTGRRAVCTSLQREFSAGTRLPALLGWKGGVHRAILADGGGFRADTAEYCAAPVPDRLDVIFPATRRPLVGDAEERERAGWSVLCFDQSRRGQTRCFLSMRWDAPPLPLTRIQGS